MDLPQHDIRRLIYVLLLRLVSYAGTNVMSKVAVIDMIWGQFTSILWQLPI